MELLNKFIAAILATTLITLCCVSRSSGLNKYWDDLTLQEMQEVKNYMFKEFPHLVQIDNATLNDSYIVLITLSETKKDIVLQQAEFNRSALVVAYFGSGCVKCPYVGEFVVYPTVNPVSHLTLPDKPFSKRPITAPEENEISNLVTKETVKLNNLLEEAYGAIYNYSCNLNSSNCLTYMYTTPNRKPLGKAERIVWVRLYRNVLPLDHHPIDVELLFLIDGVDATKFQLQRIWIQGKYFKSAEELLESYKNGSFVPKKLPYFSMPIRLVKGVSSKPSKPIKPAKRGFSLQDETVSFYKWKFHVAFRSLTGLRIFNTTFAGKSIAYEIGLAETGTWYSGLSPFLQSTMYIESQWGMGNYASNLWPGKDCPITALYLPATVYTSGVPRYMERAICIFEYQIDATNIKRHAEFSFTYPEEALYYNGDADTVLIVRSISTMFNYDYIFDYVFHKTGAITSNTRLTGNVFTDVVQEGQGLEYGYPLFSNGELYGPLHIHLFSFKVDLDILTPKKNIVRQMSMIDQEFKGGIWNKVLKVSVPQNETDAQMGNPTFTYICYTGDHSECGDVHQRIKSYANSTSLPCYNIINEDWTSKLTFAPNVYFEKGLSWARYPIAITKRKDNEWLSSSIYNGVDPVEPEVYFQGFIDDNENIVNEDLVAWITVGHIHTPTNEDFPQATTPGAKLTFMIKGSNFYESSPEP